MAARIEGVDGIADTALDESTLGGVHDGDHDGPPDGSSSFGKELGARLRAIRQQQGLSLHGVEERSGGRWKAVVVGSYERGDRAVTVARLAELAGFYGVPITELLPGRPPDPGRAGPRRLVLDLSALARVPVSEGAVLARFVAAVQMRRGDYNGRVLTLRHDDLLALAVLFDESPGALVERLVEWGVLPPDSV